LCSLVILHRPFLGAHFHAHEAEKRGGTQPGGVYIAFNAGQEVVLATLPEAPTGMIWLVQTNIKHIFVYSLVGIK
jgi:hypothetical protein